MFDSSSNLAENIPEMPKYIPLLAVEGEGTYSIFREEAYSVFLGHSFMYGNG